MKQIVDKPRFNYCKLLGRLKEKGLTQGKLASEIGINPSTLSLKLNGQGCFSSEEIDAICEKIDIHTDDIGQYFFCR